MTELYFWTDRTESYNFEDLAVPDRGFLPGNLGDGERGHMPGNVDGADSSDSLIVLTTDYDALFI